MKNLFIFDTLKETLQLSAKHFRLLLCVGVALAAPVTVQAFAADFARTAGATLLPSFLALPIAIIQMLFDAVCRAAILGVLAEPAPELAGTAMRAAIRTRTWTLFRVGILLTLMVIPVGLIVGFFGVALNHLGTSVVTTTISIVFGLVFLLFMKYALADPLVVVKGMGARDSLKSSWRMTRGHFGYVLGCYLLLGVAIVVIQTFLPFLPYDTAYDIIAAILINIASAVAGSVWTVLAWVMYVRIVLADAQAFRSSAPLPALEDGQTS